MRLVVLSASLGCYSLMLLMSIGYIPLAVSLNHSPLRRFVSLGGTRATVLFGSGSSKNGGENHEEGFGQTQPRKGIWATKNDFRTFLNQCTVQSFLFLVRQMRDVQTVAWLEEFTQPTILFRPSEMARELENYQTGEFVEPSQDDEGNIKSTNALSSKLLRYHGLGAMNTTRFPTWESYFLELLKEPKETWTIQSTRAHIPTYDMEINPASLCARMISVREQIAKEWDIDLGVIASLSRQTIDLYFEKLKQESLDGLGTEERALRIERLAIQDMLFLEWSPTKGSDLAPSPLRQGNFDLLMLQTTQEAIHRILNDKERLQGPDDAVLHQYLENFYTERLPTHFIGGQRYGRSNEFLQELLAVPPSVLALNKEQSCFVDPVKIAETILLEREMVALEWQAVSRGSSNEHYGIRRMMLNKLMGIEVGVDTSSN